MLAFLYIIFLSGILIYRYRFFQKLDSENQYHALFTRNPIFQENHFFQTERGKDFKIPVFYDCNSKSKFRNQYNARSLSF